MGGKGKHLAVPFDVVNLSLFSVATIDCANRECPPLLRNLILDFSCIFVPVDPGPYQWMCFSLFHFSGLRFDCFCRSVGKLSMCGSRGKIYLAGG